MSSVDLLRRLENPPFGTETSERNLMNSAAERIRLLEKAVLQISALSYLRDTQIVRAINNIASEIRS